MKRLGMRLGIAVAVCLVLTSFVSPVAAQTKSVVVQHRNADMTLQLNGDVQVVETWDVQFSGGPFTTAYRSIPLNKVDSIDSWSVADETQSYQQVNKGSNKQPYTFEYTIGDGVMKATWFFPSTTDQTRTFKIGYMLHGAVRIDPAGDEFYWKFIEADRQYTINLSRVVLQMPTGFKADRFKVTTYRNSVAGAGAHVIDDRAIEFNGGPFPGGVEWEIRVQFPHGVLTTPPPQWQTAPIPAANIPPKVSLFGPISNLALIIAIVVLVVTAVGTGRWLKRLKQAGATRLWVFKLLGAFLAPSLVSSVLLLIMEGISGLGYAFFFVTLGLIVDIFIVSNVAHLLVAAGGGGGDWGGGGGFDGGGGGGDGGGSGGGDSGFS